MKFNEFKPQLTEEREALVESMLIEYFKDNISKQDLIVKLHEHGIDENWKADGLSWLLKKGRGLFKGKPKQGSLNLKGGTGKKPSTLPPAAAPKAAGTPVPKGKSWVAPVAVGVGGVVAIDALSGDDANDADASPRKPVDGPPTPKAPPPKALTPKAPKPGGEQSFGQAFSAARKAQGGPGGKFSYKGKEYQTNIKGEKYAKNPTSVGPNKTLALQQKLKAAGADIKADGLMGPNTRAAMKKYGIGQSKPAAPAPARPRMPSTDVQSGGAGGEFDTSKPAAPRKTGRLPKFQPGTMSV